MKQLLSFLLGFFLISLNLANAQSVAELVEVPYDPADSSNYILHHTGYTVSFNPSTLNPSWVAWMLTKDHTNAIYSRPNTFFPDPSIQRTYRVQPYEYAKTGYDRGHMCPAADMQYCQASLHDCFYMTNMCPQSPYLNRGPWKKLEDACRKWAQTEDTLYITCGPYYSTNTDTLNVIVSSPKGGGREGAHTIIIPSGFFKVVLSLRKGHEKAIGFFYQNNYLAQSITDNAFTVDYVESLTGIDFFPNVPDSIEDRIESSYNLSDWP